MKKNETNVTGEKLLKPGIKELELTESRWRNMHQQMRKEINKDEYFVNCFLADCQVPMWQDWFVSITWIMYMSWTAVFGEAFLMIRHRNATNLDEKVVPGPYSSATVLIVLLVLECVHFGPCHYP